MEEWCGYVSPHQRQPDLGHAARRAVQGIRKAVEFVHAFTSAPCGTPAVRTIILFHLPLEKWRRPST